jgi:DNA-binding winged helix-turn-helix (wHTH) protein
VASVPPKSALVRFGTFELDIAASELRNAGRIVRLPPQPFKLLLLFTGQAGQLVTRDDIRKALWDEQTFIDFDQAVNFTVKQLREALKDDADRALYIQTVPKRGYRFIAPVDTGKPAAVHAQGTDGTLTKLLWTNVAEMRLEEQRRQSNRKRAILIAVAGAAIAIVAAILVRLAR